MSITMTLIGKTASLSYILTCITNSKTDKNALKAVE